MPDLLPQWLVSLHVYIHCYVVVETTVASRGSGIMYIAMQSNKPFGTFTYFDCWQCIALFPCWGGCNENNDNFVVLFGIFLTLKP